MTAAMATPIQGEYSPNISAPCILRNYLRSLLTPLFTLKRQIVAVKQKQSSPGRTLSTELLRASAGSLRRYPAPRRYHRLRPSQTGACNRGLSGRAKRSAAFIPMRGLAKEGFCCFRANARYRSARSMKVFLSSAHFARSALRSHSTALSANS